MIHTQPTHESPDYVCPFCQWLTGHQTPQKQDSDIVYRTKLVTAFIAPKWWINNPGHVIVIPNAHYENLYVIPDDHLAAVSKTVKQMAIAIRHTYGCDGTSTRQHNEPSGNQAVWHLHVHVFPRYQGDNLYQLHDKKYLAEPHERAVYANKLKDFLAS